MEIWALTDNRIGNSKQTLALAHSLGDVTEKKVEFSNISKLPNQLLGRTLVGVKADFTGKKPDLIISAGRKLARVSAKLKKEFGCKAIHIMHPGEALAKKFDYVITPNHDEITPAPNLVSITGSICSVKKTARHDHKGVPQIAVLIGSVTADEAKQLVNVLNDNKGLYLVTTSRRTPEDSANIIDTGIRQPHQFYKYGSKGKNPYNQFLESADIIIVSGDSVNMITEAGHSGKPVYVLEVETKEKFKSFWQELYKLKIARKLESKLEAWEYKPLDNLKAIKKKIKL